MKISLLDRLKLAGQVLRQKSIDDTLRSILVGNAEGEFISPSFRSMALHGYRNNEIVFCIINDIARSAASVKLLIDELPRDVQELLKRPEQGKQYKTWMFEQMVYRLIGGASYAEIIRIGERITELPIIRPDRISPEIGIDQFGICEALLGWHVTCGFTKPLLPEDVWFSKLLDPLREWHGWGPLQATRDNVQNRNEISRLNRDILANDGAPFGILKLQTDPKNRLGKSLNEDQMNKLQIDINDRFRNNRGGIPVINYDFVFERLGQTGREMDFSKTDEGDARKTAMGFCYPPELLGFAAGSTFNNRKEAKEFLWLNTVLPHLKLVLCDLALLLKIDEIKIDVEGIEALSEVIMRRRKAAREDMLAGVISIEEAREEGGYPEDINGTLLIPANRIPIGTDFPESDSE